MIIQFNCLAGSPPKLYLVCKSSCGVGDPIILNAPLQLTVPPCRALEATLEGRFLWWVVVEWGAVLTGTAGRYCMRVDNMSAKNDENVKTALQYKFFCRLYCVVSVLAYLICDKKQNMVKIPHTGDINSLDVCG